MPDPDIPPVVIEEDYIEKIRKEMPDLPDDYRQKFSAINIDAQVVEDIIAVPETAKLVSGILEQSEAEHARRAAFWMMQPASDDADDAQDGQQSVTSDQLIALSRLVSDNKLSSTAAKEVLVELIKNGGEPEQVAADKNLLQVSDEGEVAKIVEQALKDNPKAAEDVKNGEMKAIGFLVGQVMKASQGKANPGLAQQLIKKRLGL